MIEPNSIWPNINETPPGLGALGFRAGACDHSLGLKGGRSRNSASNSRSKDGSLNSPPSSSRNNNSVHVLHDGHQRCLVFNKIESHHQFVPLSPPSPIMSVNFCNQTDHVAIYWPVSAAQSQYLKSKRSHHEIDDDGGHTIWWRSSRPNWINYLSAMFVTQKGNQFIYQLYQLYFTLEQKKAKHDALPNLLGFHIISGRFRTNLISISLLKHATRKLKCEYASIIPIPSTFGEHFPLSVENCVLIFTKAARSWFVFKWHGIRRVSHE